VKKVIGVLDVVSSFSAEAPLLEARKGAASRSHRCCGLNGYRNSTVDPAIRGVKRALTVPWMWWRGKQWSRRSVLV